MPEQAKDPAPKGAGQAPAAGVEKEPNPIYGKIFRNGVAERHRRGADGRTRRARRYAALLAGLLDQYGEARRLDCEQLAGLLLHKETMEGALMRGETVRPNAHVRIVGAINFIRRRLAEECAAPSAADAEREEREAREAGLIT